MSNINTDVLIVGAGPSGLVMAIELGRRGVSCLVIDEKIKIAEVLKANATQELGHHLKCHIDAIKCMSNRFSKIKSLRILAAG